jgi:predicted dehydrogenase
MAVRLGFLGAGLVAQLHRDSLQSAAASDVVWAGVFDPDQQRAERFAVATGAKVCRTEEEAFDLADAVYVCTWTSEHPRLVAAAAARGLAIYCEKPLAPTLAQAREVADSVRAAGVINQVGLVLRHSPAFRWLRALIDDPASGRLMAITFRDDQYLPVRGYYGSSWRADVTRAGAGVLIEHSIHDMDMLEFLAGPMRTVSCTTLGVHGIAGIEDMATLSMRFESEASGTLTTVWHDIDERSNERRVEVFCENLWCSLDPHFRSGPVSWQRPGEPLQHAGGRDLLELIGVDDAAMNPDRAFVLAVAGQEPAQPDFTVGLRAHELVDAGYRSARSGGTLVDLPPPRPQSGRHGQP